MAERPNGKAKQESSSKHFMSCLSFIKIKELSFLSEVNSLITFIPKNRENNNRNQHSSINGIVIEGKESC